MIPFGTAIMARDMTAMAGLLHPDRGGSTVPNELASALAESESRPDRR